MDKFCSSCATEKWESDESAYKELHGAGVLSGVVNIQLSGVEFKLWYYNPIIRVEGKCHTFNVLEISFLFILLVKIYKLYIRV